jgi:hydroxymethylpyrimidine/phosphomethylpyrimidine kinase
VYYRSRVRAAIAIGGLDPSAGAGLLADARAIRAAGAWPAVVCAVLTVQSTRGLKRAQPVDSRLVAAQLDELLRDLDVRALKTGALGSRANASVVAAAAKRLPLIVDPVLAPSRARAGLKGSLNPSRPRELWQRAALLTPNVPEAEALLGASIESAAHARDAAAALLRLGPRAVLLKGGHLRGARVNDFLATERRVATITHARVRRDAHGTGCTLASLIAGRWAALGAPIAPTDDALLSMVRWATTKLAGWLRAAMRVGSGMRVLGPES